MRTLTILLCLALMGCERCYECSPDDVRAHLDQQIEVYEFEGCEYLCSGLNTQNSLMTHKGNCRNPIHGEDVPIDTLRARRARARNF